MSGPFPQSLLAFDELKKLLKPDEYQSETKRGLAFSQNDFGLKNEEKMVLLFRSLCALRT